MSARVRPEVTRVRLGGLRRFARDWNRLAERNAYGAILADDGPVAKWDADAFFATGRDDVERFMASLSRIGPAVARRRALDFGCGVGRITRSLAPHFDAVVGVDVAPEMIERARELNAHCRNCEFLVSRHRHLKRFRTGSFDVVYCRLVLQHVPRTSIRAYLSELIRVLSRGGALMFQLPETVETPLQSFLRAPVVGGRLKRALPAPLVRAHRYLKYAYLTATASEPRMRMAGLPFGEVSAIIQRAGGRLLEARPDDSHGIPSVAGFEYWVTK